jgi:biotin operon repressor
MAGKDKKPSATVILIPKQLRAEWMDVMALDSAVSHAAFRCAGVIGSHFNRHTGKTFLSQETIARVMNVSQRTAWTAVTELERLGYLIVVRRELGSVTRKKKDGTEVKVRVAGAKGAANVYLPAFERSQVAATNSGSKLATRCDLLWEQRSQSAASKVAANCDPTLTSSSKKYPERPSEPFRDDALGSLGAAMRRRLGDATYRSWFGQATIAAETPDTLTLAVSSTFARDHIIAQFSPQILACCRAARPAVLRVDVVVRDAA